MKQEAYRYFCDLCKIPHGSYNEKAISDYLLNFGKELGLDAVQDRALNVLIRKPGSAGRENEAPIILQSHMDMVCEKNDDVKHDFLKDPIIPVLSGDWVKAKGTTLGADNAAGIGIIMAILAAKNLSHPPIEALLTTEEEVGCTGAAKFDTTLLKGKHLITLDAVKEGVLLAGCSGATIINTEMAVEREAFPENFSSYKLMIKGLKGGHSGNDIHKGRGNANVFMAHLLEKLYTDDIRIISIKGGSKMNAIPRECGAVICFDAKVLEKIKSKAARTETELKARFPSDPDLCITLEKTDDSGSVMTRASLRVIIDTVLQTPLAVQSMSPDIPGLVQTSSNPGVIFTDEKRVTLINFLRSSETMDERLVIGKFKLLERNSAVKVIVSDRAPMWEFKPKSPFRDKLAAIFMEVYGKAPVITAVHGGLECAVFAESIPGGEFISFGMEILDAHSPDERMNMPSFNRTCDFLARILEKW